MMKFSQRITYQPPVNMQPPEAVVVNGGKGEGRSQYIYSRTFSAHDNVIRSGTSIIIPKHATSIFFSSSKNILVRNTHYCIVALYGQLESLNTKVVKDSHPYLIVSCLDVTIAISGLL